MNIGKGQHFFQSAVLFCVAIKNVGANIVRSFGLPQLCSVPVMYLSGDRYMAKLHKFFAILQMVTFRNRVVVFLQSRNCAAPLQCLNYRRGDLWSPAYHLSLAYFISYVSVSSLPNNNHNRLRKSPVRSLSVHSFVSPYLYHSK